MKYIDLLRNLGFDSDPFAKTNADEEDRLVDYFIAPPFFTAVFGDINTPCASLVFAPRGNGKTALKRKIELSSVGENFLCIAYNSFRTSGKSLGDITSEFHLRNIIRIIVIALISSLGERGVSSLTGDDRHIIYLFIKDYLSAIDQSELKENISSVKNLSIKARELWNAFTGPIGLAIFALCLRAGLKSPEIQKFETMGGALGDVKDQLQVLGGIARKLGYLSIYILVDKIDENNLTANASGNSYKFISPMIADLQLLEMKGYGFKFFLWDMLLDEYRKIARPDRIKYYQIKWNAEQLVEMLSKRMRAFSGNKISSLRELISEEAQFNLDLFVALFAQGSPRTMIRICKEIFDQQSEVDPSANTISPKSIQLGFEKIATDVSAERYNERVFADLQKARRCNFTIKYIYSDVFKFTQQAGLNKIRTWEDAGAVKSIGTIQATKGARTSNHYGLADLLLAKAIFPDLPIFEFANQKLRICSCGEVILRDYNLSPRHRCEYCQGDIVA